MLTRPTNQDFKNIALMIEASSRLSKLNMTLEESLRSGSLSSLLTEGVSEEEAQKLEDAIAQTKEGLEALAGSMPATKMENVKAYFEELMGSLPDNGAMIKMAIKGDTKGMQKGTESASAAMTQIQKARDSFANAVSLLGAQLAKTKFATEAEPEIIQSSLKDLANKSDEERDDFPDEKTLRKGIERSFVPSKESQGWFGKAMSWLKGKLGKELDKKVFTEDVLGLSLEELAGMVESVAAADKTGDKGEEVAAAAIAGVEDVLTGEEPEGGAEGADSGDVKNPEKPAKRPEFDLMAYIEKNYHDFFKKLSGAGMKDDSPAVEDIDAAVEAGEISPEDALEDLGDEANLDDAAGKKWKDIAQAVLQVTDDGASAKKILQNLGKVDGFKQVLSDKGVVFEESFNRRPVHSFLLSDLLNEEIAFDELVKMSGADELGDDVDKTSVLSQVAQGINDAMEDEIVVDISGSEEGAEGEGTGEEGAPAASEQEAEEEQENAQEELEAAVEEEAADAQSPLDAAMGAIDSWYDGLSPTSQKTMNAKDRIGGLKTGIGSSLESASDAVTKVVAKAVKKWRSEHEETLVKSKRFAKKNFDALEQLIPKLVGLMMKKSNESNVVFTPGQIEAFTNAYLNKWYSENIEGVLSEALISPAHQSEEFVDPTVDRDSMWTNDELVRHRWLRAAGIKGY